MSRSGRVLLEFALSLLLEGVALDVLAEGGGVGVTLCAVGHFAAVRFLEI